MAADKLNRLRDVLRGYESCLVAYSGGVDSVLLAHVAHEVLAGRMLAVLADSPSLPRRELAEAREIAEAHGFPLRIVHTREFANPDYTENPVNRCYYCKHELFTRLEPIALEGGFAVLAYGENASDIGDHRPGAEAAKQFEVRAPLKEAGLAKGDIRTLSAALGLPTADKPQMPCLSSRIPYGQAVTPEKLAMVEQAEGVLRDAGFREVRVRHHDQPGGALARLELGQAEIKRFVAEGMMETVSLQIREAGFSDVILDTKGYRRGSLNEGVALANG
ncbi:MAG: TIGR00268 family protein [Verrucomicrobiales bacterium]|jgi:uncharacterized protein|nr:TIGR00268 family protein [Verrucomicrobiales bacterium]MDP6677902.1 ATP-dependent sacrificial sulfur transferase LarE [Verrucomicrobiota bacterium]MDP6752762.1 ATP-dependent sacrificial sulfur transferase LarE [Verrucomicrobiota bacterium]